MGDGPSPCDRPDPHGRASLSHPRTRGIDPRLIDNTHMGGTLLSPRSAPARPSPAHPGWQGCREQAMHLCLALSQIRPTRAEATHARTHAASHSPAWPRATPVKPQLHMATHSASPSHPPDPTPRPTCPGVDLVCMQAACDTHRRALEARDRRYSSRASPSTLHPHPRPDPRRCQPRTHTVTGCRRTAAAHAEPCGHRTFGAIQHSVWRGTPSPRRRPWPASFGRSTCSQSACATHRMRCRSAARGTYTCLQ